MQHDQFFQFCPPFLDGFCKAMALRRASFSGVVRRTLVSPENTVKDESKSSSPMAAGTSEKEVPKILSVLSVTLDHLIARNEQDFPMFKSTYKATHMGSPGLVNGRINSSMKLTLFHGLRPPNIGVYKYLERIYKYTSCSPSCFVVAYAFIDRLVYRQPDQPVTSLNVHRLLITSILLAAKTLDDVHYNNAFYARVGGVSIAELNRMEVDLLFRLDFRMCVSLHAFESYCCHLEQEFLSLGCKLVEKRFPIFVEAEDSANAKKSPTLQG